MSIPRHEGLRDTLQRVEAALDCISDDELDEHAYSTQEFYHQLSHNIDIDDTVRWEPSGSPEVSDLSLSMQLAAVEPLQLTLESSEPEFECSDDDPPTMMEQSLYDIREDSRYIAARAHELLESLEDVPIQESVELSTLLAQLKRLDAERQALQQRIQLKKQRVAPSQPSEIKRPDQADSFSRNLHKPPSHIGQRHITPATDIERQRGSPTRLIGRVRRQSEPVASSSSSVPPTRPPTPPRGTVDTMPAPERVMVFTPHTPHASRPEGERSRQIITPIISMDRTAPRRMRLPIDLHENGQETDASSTERKMVLPPSIDQPTDDARPLMYQRSHVPSTTAIRQDHSHRQKHIPKIRETSHTKPSSPPDLTFGSTEATSYPDISTRTSLFFSPGLHQLLEVSDAASNRKRISNALRTVCLAGHANKLELDACEAALNRCPSTFFIVLLSTPERPRFRALYALSKQGLIKLYGAGPDRIRPGSVLCYFKYLTARRQFDPLDLSDFSATSDAIAIRRKRRRKQQR